MIRPFTLGCALLAGLSGLFLYSKKHQTTVLDQQISGIVADTQHIRQQTAMLQTQWALLNQPDRLSHLAGRFDQQIQPMAPKQFVRMADLGQHLPAAGSIHTPNPREAIRATLAAADVKDIPAATGPALVASLHHDTPRTEVAAVERKQAVLVAKNDVEAPKSHAADAHVADNRRGVVLASAQTEARHELVKPAHHAPATDDLALALGEKPVTTEHHAPARTLVADSTPVRHAVTVSDSDRPALHTGVTRVAAYQHVSPRSASAVTVASWHPTAMPAPRYVEARATYNGSLLGRSAMGGGLPPPMPVSN